MTELRKEAQERKIPGLWKLRRAELVEILYPSTKQDNEDDDGGKKHNNPEKRESQEVRVEVLKDSV